MGKGGPEVAQKVSVTFACDYDQKEIPQGQHRRRRFSIDGRDYEMDPVSYTHLTLPTTPYV